MQGNSWDRFFLHGQSMSICEPRTWRTVSWIWWSPGYESRIWTCLGSMAFCSSDVKALRSVKGNIVSFVLPCFFLWISCDHEMFAGLVGQIDPDHERHAWRHSSELQRVLATHKLHLYLAIWFDRYKVWIDFICIHVHHTFCQGGQGRNASDLWCRRDFKGLGWVGVPSMFDVKVPLVARKMIWSLVWLKAC